MWGTFPGELCITKGPYAPVAFLCTPNSIWHACRHSTRMYWCLPLWKCHKTFCDDIAVTNTGMEVYTRPHGPAKNLCVLLLLLRSRMNFSPMFLVFIYSIRNSATHQNRPLELPTTLAFTPTLDCFYSYWIKAFFANKNSLAHQHLPLIFGHQLLEGDIANSSRGLASQVWFPKQPYMYFDLQFRLVPCGSKHKTLCVRTCLLVDLGACIW